MTTAPAPLLSRWTEAAAVATADAAPITPTRPSASSSPKTRRGLSRVFGVSLLACKALELAAAVRVQLRHLASEVAQRCVAVLLHQRVHAGLGPEVSVLLVRVCG